MATVHSYIRFSTKKQLEGDSLRRQIEAGDKWIERNGHVKSSLNLQDLGISAFKGKNKDTGKLGYFLDAIKQGRVKPGDYLLLENLDRLSREGIHEAQMLFSQILKAGVLIAVLNPYEIVYTEKSLEDLIGIMIPLIYFHLAFIESKNKSGRLSEAWEEKRKKSHEGVVIDGRAPAWLSFNPETRTFTENEGAAAVRYIFKRTVEGAGQVRVTRELQKQFKPIGKSRKWNGSYVQKILDDRTVLGERQNFTFTPEGDRVPIGKPILGYFPRVIDDAIWFQAQAKKQAKSKQKGPSGKFVNLFTGLIRNAHDGYPMHSVTARLPGTKIQRRLVSRGHLDSMPESDPVSIPYVHLEFLILRFMGELRIEDLETKFDAEGLRAKEQQRVGIESRIAELQTELSNPASQGIAYILPALNTLTQNLQVLDRELAKIKEGIHAGTPLEETQSIIKKLIELEKSGDTSEVHTFRLRLRTLIAELVESIYIKPEKHFGRVYFRAQINYRNGMFRQVNGPVGSKIGWGGHFRQVSDDEGELLTDLRDQEKAKSTDAFGALVKLFMGQVPAAPTGAIPDTLGACGDYWLAETKARMNPESFRVVPPKIKRLVDVLGADLPVEQLNDKQWDFWTRSLRIQVKEGTALSMARVTYNRSKEFVRWLIEKNKVKPWKGLEASAASVLK